MSDQDRSDLHLAVVGMSARFAGANDPDTYWRNLRDGVESITDFTDEELLARGVPASVLRDPAYVKRAPVLDAMEGFDASFFGFNPKEGAIMDPQHRHFLECAWEALESAGHPPGAIDGRVGVFAGNGMHAYMMYNLISNTALMSSEGLFLVRHTGNDKDFLATRASYQFNLTGPSISVQTACSTSLVAVHLACQSLLNGESDFALAGGVTIEQPHRVGYLYKHGEILSPDGRCRPFDASSLGTLFGSGCGVVVLRRLADALDDGDTIHAVIRATAINNDGASKVGYLAPSVDGQAQCITECLTLADVSPDSVTYVECHGTGTPVGDPIEVEALTQAFRTSTTKTGFCGIGSVKANIGHTDTAAGVASLIKVVQSLKHRQLPPTLHFERPNPAIDWSSTPFFVNAALRDWPAGSTPRRAGVSSLGVGGTNAHVLLEEATEQPASSPPPRSTRLLVFSAKSRASVDRAPARLADHLALHPELDLADAEWTLLVGRAALPYRRAIACEGESAAELLARPPHGQAVQATDSPRSVAFMFAGGGAQYPNMGRGLYETEPVYRAAVDACLRELKTLVDFDLRPLLFCDDVDAEAAATQLRRPTRTLPSLFTTQYAQAKLWMSWGIRPQAMIGHSMGEYTAACLSGLFSLRDALGIVALRGRLFEKVDPGAMLSVELDAADLEPLLGRRLSLAAVNAPGLALASGPIDAIDALQRDLKARDVQCRRVHIDVAAHSSMLDPILPAFRQHFAGVRFGEPKIPFVSNLSGAWADPEQVATAEYWVRHLREPVRFADGARLLLGDADRALLEVGPGRTLATLARLNDAARTSHTIASSLRHPDERRSDAAFMLGVLGDLWCSGVEVDWRALHGDAARRRVPLPTYAWDHQHLWIEGGEHAYRGEGFAGHADTRRSDPMKWFYAPSWSEVDLKTAEATPPGPVVVFGERGTLADAVAEEVERAGRPVIRIVEGPRFARVRGAYRVDPSSRRDHEALWRALHRGEAPVATIDLRPASARDDDDYERARARSFDGLLHWAASMTTAHRWVIVTDGAQEVAGEGGMRPIQSLALGPATVVGAEVPDVAAVAVDVRGSGLSARAERVVALKIVEEMQRVSDDRVVALRGGRRLVQSMRPVAPPAGDERPSGGVVLITGGFGGLGLAAASAFAARGAGIALVGRSPLPPRATWEDYCRTHDAGDAGRQRIEAVRALEAAGATVHAVTADVADAAALAAAIDEAEAVLGPITGVLHTAGVLDDGLIALKTADGAERVLAPKVRGTRALADALGGRSLRFCVLYSSTSAVAGLAGQVDYAAANAYLNATARARSADGWTAVGWPAWRDVGMAASYAAAHRPLAVGVGDEAPHPLLGRRARQAVNQTTFLRTYDVRRDWILDEHRLAGGLALLPGTGYLEIARAAITDRGADDACVELRDVYFLAPFAVADDAPRTLRVDLDRDADGVRFAMRSGGAGFDGERHVEGRVTLAPPLALAAVSIRDVQKRCTRRVELPAGPKADPNLRFGARWGNLRVVALGDGEALLTLGLDDAFAAEVQSFRLHPALLDFATAGAQALARGDDASVLFVPAAYQRLRFCGTMPPRIYSHVRLRDISDPSTAVYDVTVCDAQGVVVVEIEGFTMRRVGSDAFAAAPPPAEAVPVARGLEIDASLARGIDSGDGVAVLARVVVDPSRAELFVSPVDIVVSSARRAGAAPRLDVSAGAAAAPPPDGFVEPRSDTQRTIAAIWGDALGVRAVGAFDSFFELGGHSLVAIRIMSRVNQAFRAELPLRTLFEAPTVAELAALVDDAIGADETASPTAARASGAHRVLTGDHAAAPGSTAIPVVDRDAPLPPSESQVGLWFVDHLQPGTSAFNVPVALRLRGELDREALQSALDLVVARHEATRTTFVAGADGRPEARVAPAAAVPVRWADATNATAFANAEASRPFDLAAGPLFRVAVGRLEAHDHVLVATTHHIVSDEWSLELFLGELGEAYSAARDAREPALPVLPVQPLDLAAWQRERLASGLVDDQLGYWRSVLEAAPTTVALPADYARPPVQPLTGARVIHTFSPALAGAIRSLAQQHGVTMYVTMLAAFYGLLFKLTGQDDLLVGTPSSTRNRPEAEDLIGFFVNTLVLRGDVSGDPTFAELVHRTRDAALDAFAASDVPFERVVRALPLDRDPSRNPLYQVMFALFPSSRHTPMAGLTVEHLDVDAGGAPIDMTLYVSDGDASLRGIFEYNTSLFARSTVERFGRVFEALLAGMVDAPDAPISTVDAVDDAMRDTLLREWNPTATSLDPDARVHTLVEQRRKRSPDRVAVEAHNDGLWTSLTYRELDERANQVAAYLRSLGVARGDFVGVCLHRDTRLPVALLGILKAGAAYLPLDPTFPRDRLAFMLADTRAPVVLSHSELLAVVPPSDARVVALDDVEAVLTALSTRRVSVETQPDDLAYVIYTSGSTGRPKGVQVPHRAAVNFLTSMTHTPGMAADDALLAVTTISFDISVLELFLPLVVGARVAIVDKDISTDGPRLAAAIAGRAATVMQATPATWRLLFQSGWKGAPLRVLCGGEPLPKDLARQLVGSVAEVWNMYGPTETTVWSTLTRVVDPDDIHIGRPIDNTACYVLDAARRLVPPGVPGILWIGGLGVTRGYVNRADLTDARFVADPFAATPGARMYDTGDLVRWRADGALEYLSRADNQVKVRGFRIELGEIEAVLAKHRSVARAVVTAHDFGAGDVRLVGYVVPQAGHPVDGAALREACRMQLPEYMIPSLWVALDALPLTANGKVDRKALPKPGEQVHAAPVGPAPAALSANEQLLATIWSDVLHTAEISPAENFFDLGGHSLLAMQMIHRVAEATGRRFNPLEVSLQTLAQLAASLPGAASTGMPGSGLAGRPAATAVAAVAPGVSSATVPSPLYFGGAGDRTFGVALGPDDAPLGVIVCPPIGEEHADALRGLRLLATRLARTGVSTLRFDWRGTGDSDGGADAMTLERWTEDVHRAADALRSSRQPRRLAVLGVRMGGSIAALAAASGLDLHAFAAWDPVVVGRDYLETKRAAHRLWCEIEARERPEARPYFGPDELLGFPHPVALDRDLRGLDLGRLHKPPAPHALLVRHDGRPKEGGWWETIVLSRVDATRISVDEAPPWGTNAGLDAAPVPARSLQTLQDWLVARCS